MTADLSLTAQIPVLYSEDPDRAHYHGQVWEATTSSVAYLTGIEKCHPSNAQSKCETVKGMSVNS